MSGFVCRTCLGKNMRSRFAVREMMYGQRESFAYEECGSCGSLQIAEVPEDLARHYPDDYYSMAGAAVRPPLKLRARAKLLQQRDAIHVGLFPNLGLLRSDPVPERPWRHLKRKAPATELRTLALIGARADDRIVDIGCGAAAQLLRHLAAVGFRNLTGADPFVGEDRRYGRVSVLKRDIAQLEGPFDLVMLNHSFEHMPDPHAALQGLAKVIRAGGHCLLRVPTPSSEAFDRYRQDWVQLDAPRHLVLPSREGMAALAAATGFELCRTIDDSEGFQFWGSELYRRDLPLRSPGAQTAISPAEIAAYDADAERVNAAGRGDQVAFVLRYRG